MKGQTGKSFFRLLLTVLFYLITAVFFTASYFGFFLDVFPEEERTMLSWMSLSGGALCFVLSVLFSFYAKSKIYYSLDRTQTRPKRVLTVRYAAKAVCCRILTGVRKLLWALLFFAPFALSVYIAPAVSEKGKGFGGVEPVAAAAQGVLFLCGILFYSVTSARYCLSDYVLYLNPLIPAREAVVSSARLTEGKLLYIAVQRLSMLPWLLSELLLVPLPFAAVYRRYFGAVLCERIYGEDKRVRRMKEPAVTFYIGKQSRFAEPEGV